MAASCPHCGARIISTQMLCSSCAQVKLLEKQNKLLQGRNQSGSKISLGDVFSIFIILSLILSYGYSEYKKSSKSTSSHPSSITSIQKPPSSDPPKSSSLRQPPTSIVYKDYSTYREKVLKEGWMPYIRKNQIKGINREQFPELQYCFEDYCEVSFLNINDLNKVRNISFIYCTKDGYYQCPGQPENFPNVDEDIVVSRQVADEGFQRFLNKLSYYK